VHARIELETTVEHDPEIPLPIDASDGLRGILAVPWLLNVANEVALRRAQVAISTEPASRGYKAAKRPSAPGLGHYKRLGLVRQASKVGKHRRLERVETRQAHSFQAPAAWAASPSMFETRRSQTQDPLSEDG
jgi:hypothetical protein